MVGIRSRITAPSVSSPGNIYLPHLTVKIEKKVSLNRSLNSFSVVYFFIFVKRAKGAQTYELLA